jgi:undecaprenyl diphosphate synthase
MQAASRMLPMATEAALPAHIAIIMDGNGRWAMQRATSRAKGHQAGAEALRSILEACRARPYIRYVTVYAFSSENWQRPPQEVQDLMGLLRHYLVKESASLLKENMRLRFIGDRSKLAADIQQELVRLEQESSTKTGCTLTIALSYGGRQEVVRAVRKLAHQVAQGALHPDAIDESMVSAALDTEDLPEPDLLIRTGGDERLSNFLLWQSAYTELYFTEILWPDFTANDLDAAIACYSQRERRFGGRNDSI